MVDKSIQFIRDAKVTAPSKPWFTYLAPGACHAPHHVWKEWADRYTGRFSMGYERYRDEALARQVEMGLLPDNTSLPPVNPYEDATGINGEVWNPSDLVRPWDSLSDGEKRLFERQAEVYAGFASYTDAEIGRLLDYLEESDQLDNTLIVVISDNGASAEGGPNGSVNENRWYNDVPENMEENLRLLPELGSASTHPHFSNGWAMAFNTPFQLYKTNAAMEGGVADPMIFAWPDGLAARNEVRHQYAHVTDVLPTDLDCLGIDPPTTVDRYQQAPLEGVSFRPALTDEAASTGKTEQFYCMLGTRGIWRNGWHASAVHPPAPSAWGHFDQDRWQLFHLEADRSQAHDLADQNPEKLAELVALWDDLAQRYNGYPLDDRGARELVLIKRPSSGQPRTAMTLYPDGVPVPERSGVEIVGRSFNIVADLDLTGDNAEGVIYSMGARFGGHALYVQDGLLHYVYNWLGETEQLISSDRPLPTGRTLLGVEYVIEGHENGSPHGTANLYIANTPVGTAQIRTQPAYFTLSGEGATVGREIGQPVTTRYQPPYTFTGGTIRSVVIDVAHEDYTHTEKLIHGALARD